jgi:hypothetical protein
MGIFGSKLLKGPGPELGCSAIKDYHHHHFAAGYAVAQLVEALLYKPESRGFNFRWSHWNFSVT